MTRPTSAHVPAPTSHAGKGPVAFLRSHRGAALAGAGALAVALLALHSRRASAGGGGTLLSAAPSRPATPGPSSTYDSVASDVYNSMQPQIEDLFAQQAALGDRLNTALDALDPAAQTASDPATFVGAATSGSIPTTVAAPVSTGPQPAAPTMPASTQPVAVAPASTGWAGYQINGQTVRVDNTVDAQYSSDLAWAADPNLNPDLKAGAISRLRSAGIAVPS